MKVELAENIIIAVLKGSEHQNRGPEISQLTISDRKA